MWIRLQGVQGFQAGGHLLPRADHQPHADEVQRALSAQGDSDECVEEGWAKRKSKAVACPSACSTRGAWLERRRGGAPWAPWATGQIERVQDTYPECICSVSRMYLVCIQRGSDEASKIHVSWCILIVSWSVVMTRSRYMYLNFVSRCILMYRDEESKIHVSWCILTCIQCDTKKAPKIHVSWCIWYVSQNVSWTRLGYV